METNEKLEEGESMLISNDDREFIQLNAVNFIARNLSRKMPNFIVRIERYDNCFVCDMRSSFKLGVYPLCKEHALTVMRLVRRNKMNRKLIKGGRSDEGWY